MQTTKEDEQLFPSPPQHHASRTTRSFIHTRDIKATVMRLHCSTRDTAKRKGTAKQKLRAEGYGHRHNQKWYIASYCIPVGGEKKTQHKDRSTYLRASNLKGQKHAERNLLLFLEKSSMTLTQERTVTHLLLKKRPAQVLRRHIAV